jgi:hypothetical protein
MALTDTACKQAKPTGKTFRLFDAGGLYLTKRTSFRPDVIEHQLAHAVRDPLGRAYNRTAHLAPNDDGLGGLPGQAEGGRDGDSVQAGRGGVMRCQRQIHGRQQLTGRRVQGSTTRLRPVQTDRDS